MTIVEEIRQNPESGARRLEAEYKAGLTTLARRFCNDPGDAEELVNRTFAAVIEGIDGFLEQSSFFTWMCQILANINAMDCRRKSRRMEVFPGDMPDVEDEAAGDAAYRALDAALLREAIRELPEDQRESIVLHYFLDIPVARMAKILAVPAGTVKSRLHYARIALAARMGAKAGDMAKKPGGRALLLALALCGFAALGAGVYSLAVSGSDASTQRLQDDAAILFSGRDASTKRPQCASAASASDSPDLSDSSGMTGLTGGTAKLQLSTFDLRPSTFDETQGTTTMKTRTFLSAAFSAALATATASADTCLIEESDLLGGTLPDALVLDSSTGFTTNRLKAVGSDYNSCDFFDAAKLSTFKMSDSERYIDVTLKAVAYFNTYSINVNKYNANQGANRAPKSWEVYGSKNTSGDDWTLLTSESNQTGWQIGDVGGEGETRLYRFTNGNQSWRRIRFKFLENNGQGTYMLVSGIKIYPPTSLATGATAETFAGCSDLVPAPTTDTLSRYTASGTFFNTSFNAGSAFAAGSPSRCVFNWNASTDTGVSLTYEFGAEDPQIVNGYLVWMANHQYSGTGYAPCSWTFSGSNDNAAWTVLDERTEQYGWELNQKRYYAFDNHDAYAYYKIEFTGSNGGSRIEIGSLDYYRRSLDGVFFETPTIAVSDGAFTVSGALAADSIAADVTLRAATNGISFEVALGAKQPGETFSATIPGTGLLYAALVGASGAYTNETEIGFAYAAGDGAARFVSPDGDDENAGTSPDAPLLHIADAVAALGSAGGAVYVLPGSYAETNDLSAVELSTPVAVIGATGDPADALVTASGAPCGYARVFRLANASALVRALTIYGGSVQNEPNSSTQTAAEANASLTAGTAANGGNVWIEGAGGVVEKCIIRDGTVARYSTAGGNVYLQGGRLSRCVLTGGRLSTNLDLTERRPCGTSLYARGGVIESCLFTNTTQSVVPVCVEGSSTKLLNCTIAGNTGKTCGGVVIKTTSATVANTVIYGNSYTDGEGDAVWLPLTGVDAAAAAARFVNCATDNESAINTSCRVVDSTAFADASAGDYAPASRESALVNRGVDYATYGGVSDFDLAGNPRVWKTRVDVGAYELQYDTDPPFTMVIR